MDNSQHYQCDKAAFPLSLGLGGPDALLGGGLARRALHEIAPLAPIHFGATCGFVLALAALAGKRANNNGGRDTLWIQTDMARFEAGAPYGIGLDLFGLPSRRLLVLRARRPIDALFAMEEALKCRAIASVIAELPDDTADLTATRRLSLAARTHDGIGLLLRHRSTSAPSAAMTRWTSRQTQARATPSADSGTTSFLLSLVKNRRGPCGAFRVAWIMMNSHSSRRILSLWLRRLPTDRLTRQSPELAGQPLAVVATIQPRGRSRQ